MRLTEKFKNNYWDEMELNYSQNNTSQIIDKLGQLEDIEDELGIDLITLFKALKNGFYRYKSTARNNISCFIAKPKINRKQKCFTYGSYGKSYFKDYGKTWALTKEELEK